MIPSPLRLIAFKQKRERFNLLTHFEKQAP